MSENDLQLLQLIHYEGAGNKTPILAIDTFVKGMACHPEEIRFRLERDMTFRRWLQEQGRKHNVDSIMICYRSQEPEYDYVTFVGEPHSDLSSGFSNMCGNGIRCLALHIVASEQSIKRRNTYIQNGIKIWAGDVKHINVLSFHKRLLSAEVEVSMGRFYSDGDSASPFVNTSFWQPSSLDACFLPSRVVLPDVFYKRQCGFGYNGDKWHGEPHIVFLNTLDEYEELITDLGIEIDIYSKESLFESLRRVVCMVGKGVTFQKDLFPLGVNVNVGVIDENILFIATHERNLSEGRQMCQIQQEKNNICRCQTKACGTGGAVAANIAIRQGYLQGPTVTTVHPGGILRYTITDTQTIMVGPARKVESYD